jgi:hypothetical protein
LQDHVSADLLIFQALTSCQDDTSPQRNLLGGAMGR